MNQPPVRLEDILPSREESVELRREAKRKFYSPEQARELAEESMRAEIVRLGLGYKPITYGAEIEGFIVDKNGNPVSAQNIIEETPHALFEAGESQIEVARSPIEVHVLEDIQREIQSLRDLVSATAARYGRYFVTHGTIPSANAAVSSVPLEEFDPKSRYNRMDWYLRLIEKQKKKIALNKIEIEGKNTCNVINATHINLEVNAETAIPALNKLFEVEAYCVLLCGNARFINGEDTEYNDLRVEAWRQRHEATGLSHRVGIPERYFTDLEDYARWCVVDEYSDIGAKANGYMPGINYLIGRIKRPNGVYVLEGRAVSAQSTAFDETVASALKIGLLHYHLTQNVPLLPIATTQSNFALAQKYGLDAMLYTHEGTLASGKDIAEQAIMHARMGLLGLGYEKAEVDEFCTRPLRQRVATMSLPSVLFARSVAKYGMQEALLRIAA